MASTIDELSAAGFSDEEIADYIRPLARDLSAAGFSDNEIEAHFVGSPVVPDQMPDAMAKRIQAGEEARTREGGLMQTIPQFANMIGTSEGRGRLWDAVKKYPARFVDSMVDQVKMPGEVVKGNIDLNTPDGIDQAIGLGMLVAGSRLSKLPATGKTSGLGVQMGDKISRIDRSATGELVDIPVGELPRSGDFVAAARAVGEDASMARQEKMLKMYEDQGAHPAEIAHDAASNPVLKQKMLSSDPLDVFEGYGAPGWQDAARAKIAEKIDVGGRPEKQFTWSKFYTQTVDDLHPIQAVSEDAYQAARLVRGQFGKADTFINNGTFDFNTYKTTGKPLSEVLAPVRDDLQPFREFITARRAVEIAETGREAGFNVSAARDVVSRGEAKYGKVADELVTYQNEVLRYLKDSGVLSERAYGAMVEANKAYVPFYRVFGEEGGGPGGAGKALGPGNPVKKLKGSDRGIVDPLESVIKNTYAYISVAERNAAGVRLIEALQAQGLKATERGTAATSDLVSYLRESGVKNPEALADFVQGSTVADGSAITAFKNGRKISVQVDDAALVAAFRGLDQQSAGMIARVFAVPASSLRAGAVLTPEFMARNLVRDFMTAFVNSKGLFSPIDTLKGFKSAVAKDDVYWNWKKSGGDNATMVALDRRYIQENLTKLTADTGLGTRAWNVVTNPLAGLRMVSELTEQATRLGEFQKVLKGMETKEMMQSAAYASREVTLDFARVGAKMRAYNMVTAFANAQIQGVDRIVRAAIDRPLNTTVKIAGGVTMPSVLLWFANHGDPRYEELPDWQKDLFWIIPTDKWEPISPLDAQNKPEHLVRQRNGRWEVNNGHIWRVPKPFEVGVIFGSGVERTLSATIGKDKEAFDGFAKSVVNMLTPSVVPTAAVPVFEQWANRSSFTDRTLIPAPAEKLLPEYQYTPYTTELSKALGRVVASFPGLREASVEEGAVGGAAARAVSSPILIENYLRGWTGGLGVYALNIADASLRKSGVLPDPVTPTPTLADIPFVKAFAVRYPSASAESIQKFYDEYGRDKRYFDSWMAKAKEGDADAMQRIEAAGGPSMFLRLDAFRQALTEHSALVRDIYKAPDIPAEEKRQLIDGIYYLMIELARAGRASIKEIRANANMKE